MAGEQIKLLVGIRETETVSRSDMEQLTSRKLLPLPGGLYCMIRKIKAGELKKGFGQFEGIRQKDSMIALSWVDEEGDTIVTFSEEGFAQILDEIDYQIWESLYEASMAVNSNTQIDYGALVKN